MKKGNNKGFTLIELMATISILAILLALAVPSVVKYLRQSQKTVYEDIEKTMQDAAKNYLVKNATSIPLPGGYTAISVSKLVNEDYLYNIKDPQEENAFCTEESYVYIDRTKDDGRGNINIDYVPCLICARYQSKSCPSTKPGNFIK